MPAESEHDPVLFIRQDDLSKSILDYLSARPISKTSAEFWGGPSNIDFFQFEYDEDEDVFLFRAFKDARRESPRERYREINATATIDLTFEQLVRWIEREGVFDLNDRPDQRPSNGCVHFMFPVGDYSTKKVFLQRYL